MKKKKILRWQIFGLYPLTITGKLISFQYIQNILVHSEVVSTLPTNFINSGYS